MIAANLTFPESWRTAFNPVEKLGEGNDKTVWKVYDISSKTFKAIAKYHGIQSINIPPSFSERQISYFREVKIQEINVMIQREIWFLKRLARQPNVVQLEGTLSDGIFPALLMRYYEGGNLAIAIANNSLSRKDKERIALSLLRGLISCHEMHVSIKDLKPANILLTSSRDAVLSDFGIADYTKDPGCLNENTYYLFANILSKFFFAEDGNGYAFVQRFLQTYNRHNCLSSKEAYKSFALAIDVNDR